MSEPQLRQGADGTWWQQSSDESWVPCEFDLTQAPDGRWWVKTGDGQVELLDPQLALGHVDRTVADLRVPKNVGDARAFARGLAAPIRAAIRIWRRAKHPWVTVATVIALAAVVTVAKTAVTNHNNENQHRYWEPKIAHDVALALAAIQEVSRLDDLYGDAIDPSTLQRRYAAMVRAAQQQCIDKVRLYQEELDEATASDYAPSDPPRTLSLTQCWSRWLELRPGFEP